MACRRWSTDDKIKIEYLGTAEELIASEISTADMLIINNAKGPRVKRVDEGGFRFHLTRRWRSTDSNGEACQPYQWFSIIRERPLAQIDELPWAQEAVAAAARYKAWRDSFAQHREERDLVVDSASWPNSHTRH